jgi:hypothetical protein
MKNPFKPDPDDSLVAATAALARTEQRIAELQIERTAKIETADGDYVTDVAKIDREIIGLGANASVHRDRMEAMEAKRRQQVLARLEQEKTTGVAEVRKQLGKRHDAARKLDAALAQVTQAFAELIKTDEEAFSNFPPSVSPLGRLNHFRLEAFEALSTRRMQRPPSAGIVRCVAEHEQFQFADAIEARNREVIEMLEGAPIEQEDAAA